MSASPALRIAIIEDEAVLAMELEELIAELGHTLAGSAMDATEAEGLGDVAADLAMVDIHLADGPTGVEVGRRLAARGVAVVFMTANIKRLPDDYAGALGAIGKPYTQAGFAAALSYIGALLDGGRADVAPPRSLIVAPGAALDRARARRRGPADPRTDPPPRASPRQPRPFGAVLPSDRGGLMTAIRRLAPHDPLPGGHSVVLMRRLAEDDPDGTAVEMIVTNPDGSERTETPVGADGAPLSFAEAVPIAQRRAEEEGLKRIWIVDRTGGELEGEVLALQGDHSFPGETLDDDDMEDGEHGADMRDGAGNAAPRRF